MLSISQDFEKARQHSRVREFQEDAFSATKQKIQSSGHSQSMPCILMAQRSPSSGLPKSSFSQLILTAVLKFVLVKFASHDFSSLMAFVSYDSSSLDENAPFSNETT